MRLGAKLSGLERWGGPEYCEPIPLQALLAEGGSTRDHNFFKNLSNELIYAILPVVLESIDIYDRKAIRTWPDHIH